jgi:hypothetical protein
MHNALCIAIARVMHARGVSHSSDGSKKESKSRRQGDRLIRFAKLEKTLVWREKRREFLLLEHVGTRYAGTERGTCDR